MGIPHEHVEIPQTVSVCLQGRPFERSASRRETWLALGAPQTEIQSLANTKTNCAEREADICRRFGDATIVKVEKVDGQPVLVEAWKGITSCYDLFYWFSSESGLVICDNMADLLSFIPVEERHIASHAAVDHLLFRTVPGDDTYLDDVFRLGGGSKLTVDLKSGQVRIAQFDKLQNSANGLSYTEQIDALESGLTEALAVACGQPGIASLFSGGVDSTVIQSFLDRSNGVLNLIPGTFASEWDFQKDYAAETASLMDLSMETLPVLEGNLHEQTADMTLRLGVPSRDVKTGMYAEAFAHRFDGYTIGERADALFGAVGTRLVAMADRVPNELLNPAIQGLQALGPGKVKTRARQLQETVSQLARPLDDPWGYGSLMACDGYTDFAMLESFFGRDALEDRIRSRRLFTVDRVELDPSLSPALQHLELAHWIDYFCEDVLLRIRQLAHSHGKSLICPFLSKPVVDAALKVSPQHRFVKGFQTKHMLKTLLKRRIPQYPHGRRKGITGISMAEMYRKGHFAEFWEEHSIPDFLPEHLHDPAKKSCLNGDPAAALGQITWHVMSWALWQSKVLKNSELARADHAIFEHA